MASRGSSDGESDRRVRWPSWVYRSGNEPDPRFTLANERTFLAWIRTALGLVAAGVAVKALLDGNERTFLAWIRTALGLVAAGVAVKALLDGKAAQVSAVVLVGSGACLPAFAFLRWALSERALRRGRPLPAMVFGIALAVGLSLAGVVLVMAVLA